MQKSIVRKGLVVGIILLFVGAGIHCSTQGFLTIRIQPVQAFSTNTSDQVSINDTTTYYAVISACSRYQDPKNNVPRFSPASDSKLKVLYDALLQTKNWQEENIILLLNEKATRQSILDALETMSTMVGPNDVFLFTWSGHGTMVLEAEGKKTVSICPYDITIRNGSFLNLISSDELGFYFSKIQSKGKCLVFECCFSGGLVDWGDSLKIKGLGDITPVDLDFIRELMNPVTMDVSGNNTVVIMSTRPSTLSRATYATHSPLLYSIAMIVKNAHRHDMNKDGFVSAEEIFKKARPMTLFQSSFQWMFTWLIIYLFFKFDMYDVDTGFRSSFLSLMSELYGLFDMIVPNPALLAFCFMLPLYLGVQLLYKFLNGYFILNWPNMHDNYFGELPIVQI